MASYKMRRYECPACGGQFDHFHTVTDGVEDAPPDYCPKCGAYVGADQEPIPFFSRVGKAENQTMDKVYRGMEAASEARAQEAADLAGVPVSEMSGVKITNMKDNLREGDTSYIVPQSQEAAVMRGGATPASSADVAALRNNAAPLAGMGPQGGLGFRPASAGTKALDTLIRPNHAQRAAQMQRAGQMASFKLDR